MTRSNLANLVMRTIQNVERRHREMEESVRQAAAMVPKPVRVLVILASIFLAFAQLIRPR